MTTKEIVPLSEEQEKLIRKWIAALRSGKYKQTHEALCVENASGQKAYCCLGVLCEVSELGRFVRGMFKYDLSRLAYKVDSSESLNYSTNYLVEAEEFSPLTREIVIEEGRYDTLERYLAWLNDDQLWTFEQIADYVENYFFKGGSEACGSNSPT